MEVQTILTIDLVKDLKQKLDSLVREVLTNGEKYNGPWPFILESDYDMSQLPYLATRCGVSLDVLSQYRVLADYIDQTAQMVLDVELALSPDELAADLGIDFSVFETYFIQEVVKIRQALTEEEDEKNAPNRPIQFPWETEEEMEADLQADAGLW